VLVAIDYSTKWVEDIPIKIVTTSNMVDFVNEHIVYRFGIPQTITTDQGSQFTLGEFEEYANSLGIKLLNSSPYYAQANGQAELVNEGIIKLIKPSLMKVLNDGIWSLMKHYKHIGWHATKRPRYHHINWCMVMMLYYLGS
jgi:transposase InsO family protein